MINNISKISASKTVLASLFFMSTCTFAEDIELFGSLPIVDSLKPQVLIILDTSGSMNDESIVRAPYDSNTVYPAIGNTNSFNGRAIYFTKGEVVDGLLPVPDGPHESRRFSAEINGCASSLSALNDFGFYTGYLREFVTRGRTGTWKEFPENNGLNHNPVVDCLKDIQSKNADNADLESNVGYEDGYPKDNDNVPYTAVADVVLDAENDIIDNTNFGSGLQVTLYTDNYLRWANAPLDGTYTDSHGNPQNNSQPATRIDIAKEAITSLVNSNLSVDFGLQVFNYSAGGTVIFGMQELTDSAKTTLTTTVDNITASGWTPVCETLYEASLYFGGGAKYYGDASTDTDILDGSNYETPFTECVTEVNVILITDGAPTADNGADARILALDPHATSMPIRDSTYDVDSYLAALANWMHTHDLITKAAITAEDLAANNGDGDYSNIRNANIHTVGFALGGDPEDELDVVKLLKKTADLGGGNFYEASDVSQLINTLRKALDDISASSATFTAPAVATNSFDRTETLDSIYYSMFTPGGGARWSGNLKKLKIAGGQIIDKNGSAAVKDDGNFESSALTFWSSGSPDGANVEAGGVAQMLRGLTVWPNAIDRKFLSDLNVGNNNFLTELIRSDADAVFDGVSPNNTLAVELDVIDTEIDNTIKWVKGRDVDDDDGDSIIDEMRYDVFGDPLHFKPLVVNYGGAENNQDIRIIIGTNSGVLHMFEDNGATEVKESWAYMPQEFLRNINALRQNIPGSNKVYGIDGSATIYIDDVGNDGTVNSLTDKAWVFFGLRRGGNSYYALDISKPNFPKKMWKIEGGSAGFEALGQSWSQPVIAYSKINGTKPVLIFGAGYDTGKDSIGVVGTDDDIGVGIFMVDAESGDLLWQLSTQAGATMTTFSGLDSIPSKIETLDSDGDGYTDRLYVGDTGGKIWRIDMPGGDIGDWTAIELASLGRHSQAGIINDRRFFNKPTVVRALISEAVETMVETQLLDDHGYGRLDAHGNPIMESSLEISRFEKPYDAVLLGSGNVTHPLGKDVTDKFFMIKDEIVITQTLVQPTSIEVSNLLDYTANPYEGLVGDELDQKQIDLGDNSGWMLTFEKSIEGEKSMSSAIVIAGVAYFNTYTPGVEVADESCGVTLGEAAIYPIGLALGTTVYDQRRIVTGVNPPGEPTIVVPPPEDPNEKAEVFILMPKPKKASPSPNPPPPCVGDGCRNPGVTSFIQRAYLYKQE